MFFLPRYLHDPASAGQYSSLDKILGSKHIRLFFLNVSNFIPSLTFMPHMRRTASE